jgi:TPR repeat protein
VPRLSLRNCQQAVKDHPGTPRFYYQLGRAYEASRRPKEALENYQKADAAGYRMAAFNLGLAYANGRGAPVDAARAEQYFRKANDAGVDAKEALAQFVFTTEGYSDPKFFAAVYNGELKGANPGQVSPYLTEFLAMYRNADANAADCRSVVSGYAYAKIAEHAQMNVLGRMLGGMASAKHRHAPGDFSGAAKAGYETGRAFKLSLALQVDKAHADAQMFYDRHGCDSPVAKRFFHNVEAYCTSLGSASLQKELKRNYTR